MMASREPITPEIRRARATDALAAGIADGVRVLRTTQAPASSRFVLGSSEPDGIDLRPATAYEAVTRQKVESLQEDLREITGRLNALLFAIAGGVAIDVIARLLTS